ncbi:CynX/NimT family MFS transporter [Alteribacillus iranensis]|nr:MFS transporter [Alteribacillus iranensis]
MHYWLLFIGIIFIGTNLRAPLTSVGALIPEIRDDFGISNALAGSITTLPLLAFALLSPFAPRIANRFGMEVTMAGALLLLFLGIVIRSLAGLSFLFTGTLFVGLAIAMGNVLIPGLVKLNFPLRTGIMTGLYAVSMNIFGALGSGLSVPISSLGNVGWRGSLAVWGLMTVLALLVWIPQLRKPREARPAKKASGRKTKSLWRSSLAWQITIFMGLQSLFFYTTITWLPDILQVHGYSSSEAGWVVFFMQVALIPVTFIMPVAAEKVKNQVGLSVGTAVLFLIGFLGLLQGGVWTPLYAALIGMGCGSGFSLAMMFFTLRSNDGYEAAQMSGMAQSFGYLLAAIGPVAVGAFQDISGSWTVPLLLLTAIAVLFLLAGIGAGKDRVIQRESL